ncbi:spermidine synthase [Nannocystis radixulma]|uniref:Polyamine aminopropyltransferase n=1 Tax=Nannocystis radixulma TaxID=2995305 RepID=A0ABT5BE54_9BACT|nr:spermidine synthase [Nannocystis radixulma]MDC0671988.1 spermidine synthase [Nannocystis radixulma]
MSARIQIGDFEELGRGLVIDGTVQLTEAVDALYTTALVFPAALSARSRRRWLVVGGGDGATPREALRFRDTGSVRLVDISRTVVERTQELIPSFWSGCQHDPRLEIIHRDAGEVLRDMADRGDQVDVILYDLSDPGGEECNPFLDSAADHMYTEEVFRLAARCLSPGGVFAAQFAELSILRSEEHRRHRRALRRVFRHVHSYRTFVEPFGYAESFIVASNDEGDWNPSRGDSASQRLAALYTGDFREVWSAPWHEQLFALPPSLVTRLG